MAEAKLLKKVGPYVDKDGNERMATNFFMSCNGVLVPIEVKFFKDPETGLDTRYRERKVLLAAFAELMPEKSGEKAAKPAQSPAQNPAPASEANNEQIPF